MDPSTWNLRGSPGQDTVVTFQETPMIPAPKHPTI